MFLEKLSDKTLFVTAVLTLVPFVLITVVFIVNEYSLISTTGYGIIHLELAWTPERVGEILGVWGETGTVNQLKMHYLDYVFIPFYVLFSVSVILLFSRKLNKKMRDVGLVIALLILIAGLLDSFENVSLILMLSNKSCISLFSSVFASFLASFKICFLISGAIFLSISIKILVLRRTIYDKD